MSRSGSKFFLDTNILIYSFDLAEDKKRREAQNLVEKALTTKTGVISFQVVQEALAVMTTKFRRNVKPSHVPEFLDNILLPLCEVMPDARLYREALSVQRDTGFGFSDSLIVAAAASSGCEYLYTEDMQDQRKVSGVTILNPFTNLL